MGKLIKITVHSVYFSFTKILPESKCVAHLNQIRASFEFAKKHFSARRCDYYGIERQYWEMNEQQRAEYEANIEKHAANKLKVVIEQVC